MDDLSRAVEQFLHPSSGGGSVPGGPPGNFPSIPVISPNNEFGENGEAPDSSKSSSWSGPWIQEWLDNGKMGSEASSHPDPAGDVSHPSSSSPAPAPKESWRNLEPQLPEPPIVPETRTFLLKGAGGRLEPVDYNPKEIQYEGACKSISRVILQTLRENGFPYGETKSTGDLFDILKRLTPPGATLGKLISLKNDIMQNQTDSPFYQKVFEELKKGDKV